MTLLWILQVFIDVLFVSAIAIWWIDRRRALVGQSSEEKFQKSLAQWESRVCDLEKQREEYRAQLQAQLQTLSKLGDEAKSILSKGQQRITGFPPSQEEVELRSLITPRDTPIAPQPKIPTLQEVERTRERLKTDMLLDLKTLLKDQLA